MAVFKGIATWELVVGLIEILLPLWNSYVLLLAVPASAGGTYLYLPVTLLLDNVAVATILIYVLLALSSAEAKAAAARQKLHELLLLASSLSGAVIILALVSETRVLFGLPAWVIMALEQLLCSGLLVVVPQD